MRGAGFRLRRVEKLWVVVVAVVWGVGAGVLIPRAAFRLCVPFGEPWRSVCPDGHRLAGFGGGWLGRARCVDGHSYGPSVAPLAVVSAGACAVVAAVTGVRPEVVVWLLLVPAGVLLAVVDVASRRLPDVLILALAVGVLALLGIAALLPGAGGSWMSALFGSFIVGACSLVVFLVSRGFGFGDVKLALLLGAVLGWYGWPVVVVGMFAGYLFGALYGMALVFAGRAGRRARIAFGPFLLAGAFVGVLWGSYAQ